ncbi:MAG: hypothetical protein IJ704_01260 [Bacilli bacterium]|nr:hypothetical protein [Bacilli bacterium]
MTNEEIKLLEEIFLITSKNPQTKLRVYQALLNSNVLSFIQIYQQAFKQKQEEKETNLSLKKKEN